MSLRLVPDELWALVEPPIPAPKTRPQGGGVSRADDGAVFTADVFVLTSGCMWRHLPHGFRVTVPTAHRRVAEWSQCCGELFCGFLARAAALTCDTKLTKGDTLLRPSRHTGSLLNTARLLQKGMGPPTTPMRASIFI